MQVLACAHDEFCHRGCRRRTWKGPASGETRVNVGEVNWASGADGRPSLLDCAAGGAVRLSSAVMAAAEDGAAVVNLENGRAIAQANCAECHAIARDDQIPTRANADTAFRDLHRRFPINMLTDAAKTGTIEGHDEMAGFDFSLNDVRDLLGYIDSLAPEQAGRYLGG